MSAVLPNTCSKRMSRSAVIGASQAHTAVNAAPSVCRCPAAVMAGCDVVYTEDLSAGKGYDGAAAINPFAY